jgi:hypothetical protein
MRNAQPTCLNVKPARVEMIAELKARARLAGVPLYRFVSDILDEYLAQQPRPAVVTPAQERASA